MGSDISGIQGPGYKVIHLTDWLFWGVTELESVLEEPPVTLWVFVLHIDIASWSNQKKQTPNLSEECILILLILQTALLCAGYPRPCWLIEAKEAGGNISEEATNTPPQIQNLKKKKGLSLLRAAWCKQYKKPKLLCHWIHFSLSACQIGVGCYLCISWGSWSAPEKQPGRFLKEPCGREDQGSIRPTSSPSASCVLQNSHCMQWWALQPAI